MKKRKLAHLLIALCLLLATTTCKRATEQETFLQKIQDTIMASEANDVPVDSVKILNIDTLSRVQYAGLILEQLENMEFECNWLYEAGKDSLPETELKELELTLTEIRDACNFYREKYENGADNNENDNFIYFVDAEIYKKGEISNFFYLITPDFVIHDDPFGDNLLE